jgi:D-3-phosphoglycerate dehydrogenase / 2-oxoglutarate reductase
MRKGSPSPTELGELIRDAHLLGIRSKTQVDANILRHAENLLGIGCFCIGTDQVDLDAAAQMGVPVFNAPFSNTRSVAELVIGEVIMLARRACEKNHLLHRGVWEKSAEGCVEVRNKTLGIIGYGHIGPQVGILAEALGMRVQYFDIVPKLPLGTAQVAESLEDVLESSDFVTLHVPETKETRGLIGEAQLRKMRSGSYLLNLSRGSVVDIEALAAALRSGHLSGAAIDVFPQEPAGNGDPFLSPLMGLPNVILTPHIGGSTLEAQKNIGLEVWNSLQTFLETGSTRGAVNFPQVDLPVVRDSHRLLNIHRNVPGVLSAINTILAEIGCNIHSQFSSTRGGVGYLIMDVEREISRELKGRIDAIPATIRTRLLF